MLSSLSPTEWILLILGALGIGVSKSGLPGLSMFHVVLYAFVFGALESTGSRDVGGDTGRRLFWTLDGFPSIATMVQRHLAGVHRDHGDAADWRFLITKAADRRNKVPGLLDAKQRSGRSGKRIAIPCSVARWERPERVSGLPPRCPGR